MANHALLRADQLAIANAADARMAVRTLKKLGVDAIKTHRQTSRDAYFAAADVSRPPYRGPGRPEGLHYERVRMCHDHRPQK